MTSRFVNLSEIFGSRIVCLFVCLEVQVCLEIVKANGELARVDLGPHKVGSGGWPKNLSPMQLYAAR